MAFLKAEHLVMIHFRVYRMSWREIFQQKWEKFAHETASGSPEKGRGLKQMPCSPP